jgi:hypothetical protein
MGRLRTKLNNLPFDLGVALFHPIQSANIRQRVIDLTTAAGWDLVRGEEGHLFIPEDRKRWQEMCTGNDRHDSNGGDLQARAHDILEMLRKRDLDKELYSVGVGLAALEFHIKLSRPDIKIFCSDYGEEATRRLRGLFTECEGIDQFDINKQRFRDLYPDASPDAVVLVHRVDPHLNDKEWARAFASMAADGVRHIFFVPHRLLTLRYLAESKRMEWSHRAKGTTLALTGHTRTLIRWRRLWGGAYNLTEVVEVGYGKGYWLEAR